MTLCSSNSLSLSLSLCLSLSLSLSLSFSLSLSLSLPTPHEPYVVAMATIARHVIANEYSLAEDSVKTVTSDSHEGTPHSDDPRTRLEESGREDSPSSTTSSQEPCDSSVVCVHDV